MKSLVIIEHDNNNIKQSSFSTITAATNISNDVEALVLGHKIDNILNELKKADNISKINFADDNSL